jgi:hypothetical protein
VMIGSHQVPGFVRKRSNRRVAEPTPIRVIPINNTINQRFTPKPGTNHRRSDLILRRSDINQTSRRLDITGIIAVFRGIVNYCFYYP